MDLEVIVRENESGFETLVTNHSSQQVCVLKISDQSEAEDFARKLSATLGCKVRYIFKEEDSKPEDLEYNPENNIKLFEE